MELSENNISTPPTESFLSRTERLIGKEGVRLLKDAKICVFGVGGVGGYAVEALARCGVGHLTLIDPDAVSVSNINRQIIATHNTVGRLKTSVAKERIHSISPDTTVEEINIFYTEECADIFDPSGFDYVIDCIDHVAGKIEIISRSHSAGVPVISSMGAGNKLDPTAFKVADISKTHSDPLAKAVRTRLRKLGINHLKVVFSDEPPVVTSAGSPASISYVPSVAGLIIASEVIKDIALRSNKDPSAT